MTETVNELGFAHTPNLFDMGLLTKALEVVWACPRDLSGVVLMEGGMHLLMSVFAGIGHIYGEAGLRHLLHDSGVYAAGSVQQMLAGKDFDRAMHGLKLVDETLTRRFLFQFHLWCERNGKVIPLLLQDLLANLDKAFEGNSEDVPRIVEQLSDVVSQNILPLINQFREEGKSISPTLKVWDSFLFEVMMPLKVFIAGIRTADWESCQGAKANLLPLLFASNRHIYAKYIIIMLLLMAQLPKHLLDDFHCGLSVAKLTEGSFNAVWMDYT